MENIQVEIEEVKKSDDRMKAYAQALKDRVSDAQSSEHTESDK